MYWRLIENCGKGNNNVVFTPHITSLLWNQCSVCHISRKLQAYFLYIYNYIAILTNLVDRILGELTQPVGPLSLVHILVLIKEVNQ